MEKIMQTTKRADAQRRGWFDTLLAACPGMAIFAAVGGVLSNDSVLWTAVGAVLGAVFGVWAKNHDEKMRLRQEERRP